MVWRGGSGAGGAGWLIIDVALLGDPVRFHRGTPTLVVDIARFLPIEEFTARVARLVDIMKSTPPAKGYDEVLVAGDPEWRAEDERGRGGIPPRWGMG